MEGCTEPGVGAEWKGQVMLSLIYIAQIKVSLKGFTVICGIDEFIILHSFFLTLQ